MYHSITFGDKNTWDDWYLIPTSRPVFNPPSVKTNYIDIPGADGIIDLTEALCERPLFNNRKGTFEFIVENGHWSSWTDAYKTIMNYLHGRRMKAVLEDDPSYYYEGRFLVNEWKSAAHWSIISIDYNVAPYKKFVASSVDPWLWDPFNFKTGVITYAKDIRVDGTKVVSVDSGSNQKVIPIITATTPMRMLCRGKTYELSAGKNRFPDVYVDSEVVVFTFYGTGFVTIDYRGGSL